MKKDFLVRANKIDMEIVNLKSIVERIENAETMGELIKIFNQYHISGFLPDFEAIREAAIKDFTAQLIIKETEFENLNP